MEAFTYNKFSYVHYVDVAKKFEPKYTIQCNHSHTQLLYDYCIYATKKIEPKYIIYQANLEKINSYVILVH
jgi:hypothetical protein